MNKHIIQNIFRHFLIRNGCYDKFKTCIYNDIIINGNQSLSIRNGNIPCDFFEKKITSEELFKEYITNVVNHNKYRNAVAEAFPCRYTIEGFDYWWDLDTKWRRFIWNYNRNINIE